MKKGYETVIRLLLCSLISAVLLTSGCMPASSPIEAPEDTRIKASSTEGHYTDRVSVSWSPVENAASYVIYRSLSSAGPFEEIATVDPEDPGRRIENVEESITVVPDPIVHPDGWIDPRYLNISYTSQKNISGDVYIAAGQNPKMRIIMGKGPIADAELNFVVDFPSLVDWLPTTWGLGYTIGQVMSRINEKAGGNFICELDPDNPDKYLKFTSQWGPIAFINDYNSLSYSPVDYIINGSVGNSQMLIVNKDGIQIINASSFTGDLSDYFGTEVPPEPDPEPIVIQRIFPNGNIFYYDDQAIELGVHYFYRVIARDKNGKLLSMSTCKEGYYISVNAMASDAPGNVTVSQGEFPDKAVISWDAVSGEGVTYNVYRALLYPGTFDSSAPLASGLTEPTYTDDSIPPGVYAYRIVAFNGAGEEGKPSETATGYRTITLDEFIHIAYYETVVGEQRTAQALGVGRVADYDSGANANVTLPGFLSGTINYRLVVSGMSGNGKWTFTDYSNFGLTINGSDDMDSGASKDGDIRGKLYVTGPYPGYIDYFLHVDGGNVATGSNSYFMVQLYSAEWMQANFGADEVRVDYATALTQSPY